MLRGPELRRGTGGRIVIGRRACRDVPSPSTTSQALPALRGGADLDILNRFADELNLEAEDVLAYQVIP